MRAAQSRPNKVLVAVANLGWLGGSLAMARAWAI
jgi:hypothetical protein